MQNRPLKQRSQNYVLVCLRKEIQSRQMSRASVRAAAGRASHKARNIYSGFPLFVYDFMSVSLLGAYCSSKSCNDRFFFLFYAELGSVIRAPFLTDRSILITKSSACSKGGALWRPMRPGRDESDTCWPKRHKAGGRWGAGRERWKVVARFERLLCACTRACSTSKGRTYRRTVRFCWI